MNMILYWRASRNRTKNGCF